MSELRGYAKNILAADCVPQQFIELDELPLNADGVLDRKALRDPFAPQDTYVAPETETQKALIVIWQEVLGVKRVGLSDNFFDMGGHSLLAIRAVIKIDKHFSVRIDQGLIIMSTLEQLAMAIDNQLMANAEAVGLEHSSDTLAANDPISVKKSKANFLTSLFKKGESQ